MSSDKPAEPNAVPPSTLIQSRLASLRFKHVSVALIEGLALVLAVSVELLAMAMFLDWWLDLPWGVRLVMLLVQGGVFGFILVRQALLPWLRQPDEDELALLVEKARPEFRSRLISAVQLTRPGAIGQGASASLVDLMVEQTEAMAAPQDFRSIVPTERVKTLAVLAVTVLFLGMSGFIYGRDVCFDLLRRAFLSHIPVPRKTRVVVRDGDKVIGRGDPVRLEAFAQGIIPADGKVEVKYRNRRTQEYNLKQDQENPAHFGRTIENVQDSFTYAIYLNDGVSGTHTVQTIPRPTVSKIECQQLYPAYTGLPPIHRPLGDLTLLAGSRLQLQITATKDLERASVRRVGPDDEIPLVVNAARPRELTGQIPIPARGMNGFSIEMLDTEGMESRDSAVYRVEILPDKAPTVRITEPNRKEELVTRSGTLKIGMDISDDFAIAKVRLHYQVISTNTLPARHLELDLAGQSPKVMKNYLYYWDLNTFTPSLVEGTILEFWLEAEDNNDATGPGLGRSEHQMARVVTAEEKLADAWNRASDYLSGIEDVAQDQERANRNLGTIILEKGGPK
jgi:Domain of unknown function (DUF4175)